MTSKIQTKTTYEPTSTIEPFYTGGDVAAVKSGQIIATSVDEDLTIVNTRDGKPLCRIEGDGEAITSLALTPSASHVVVCSRSLSMRIFALHIDEHVSRATYELHRTLKPHSTPVVSCTIDPTGTLLATGGADGSVKVWDVKDGFATHNLHPHGGVVSALVFFKPGGSDGSKSASSIHLASAGEDGKVKVHDLVARKQTATLDSHVSVVRSLRFSEAQQTLLAASRDRTLSLWDVSKWTQLRMIPALEVLETAGFLADGRYCYTGGESGVIRIWSTSTGQEVTSQQSAGLDTDAIIACVDIPATSMIVSIHQDQTLRYRSYTKLKELPPNSTTTPLPIIRRITANLDEVIDMACVGTDRSLVALATNTESVKLISVDVDPKSCDTCDAAFGTDVGLLEGHKDIIICLDVDWSGCWLATGAKDNTARLWRIDAASSSFNCVAVLEGHAESLGAIALPRAAPTSGPSVAQPLNDPPAYLLTGSQDKTIKRWDTSRLTANAIKDDPQTGVRALYTRVAHEKDINAIDVSPTAPVFASASQDKTIKIWSLEDGSVAGILRGHKRGVWSIRFSPAGTPPINLSEGGSSSSRGLLVSGSGDRTVKIWSLSTYACLLTLEGHSNSVLKVIWLPPPSSSSDADTNGASSRQQHSKQPLIASASADTLIKLWSPYSPPDSDHLLTTLDNHTDRVWALTTPYTSASTTPACTYPLISGAADATITFWRDTTAQTATIATQRATERIEQDQLLQNHIHNKNYREVITLAIALNHPGRLLKVFSDVISLPTADLDVNSIMGVKAVDDVLASLDVQQVYSLLERVRDWNTNARTSPVAQRVLSCLLRSYSADFFVEMGRDRRFRGVKDLLRALEVYTERHYRRMEELVDESYLLEYTLREMDEVGMVDGGVGNGERVNGDVIMT